MYRCSRRARKHTQVYWVVTFRLRPGPAERPERRYLYDILWVAPDEGPGSVAFFGDLDGDPERMPCCFRDLLCMHGGDAGAGRRLEKERALVALRILETDFAEICVDAAIVPAIELIAEEA